LQHIAIEPGVPALNRLLFLSLLLACGAASAAADAALRQCRTIAELAARAACYDAIPLGQPAPSAAVGAVATADAVAAFGAPAAKRPENQLKSFDTHIAGHFDGWEGGQAIRLANGQVWRVIDGSVDTLELNDPKVTVRRGLSGSVFLDIEGANRSPRVQRVQ
jgi:hypothetical protein